MVPSNPESRRASVFSWRPTAQWWRLSCASRRRLALGRQAAVGQRPALERLEQRLVLTDLTLLSAGVFELSQTSDPDPDVIVTKFVDGQATEEVARFQKSTVGDLNVMASGIGHTELVVDITNGLGFSDAGFLRFVGTAATSVDGIDTLLGGALNVILLGGNGDDRLEGQEGTGDTLAGGPGTDVLIGSRLEIDEAFVLRIDRFLLM